MKESLGRVNLHQGLRHLFGARAKQYKSSNPNIDQTIFNLLTKEDDNGGSASKERPAKDGDPNLP